MIFADLGLVAIVLYAVYHGSRRGTRTVASELVSLVVATLVALAAYHLVGLWLRGLAGMTAPLAEVAAFAVVWMVVEIGCALLVRRLVLARLPPAYRLSQLDQAGGAALNGLKAVVLVSVGLILFAGLPLSADVKQLVTASLVARSLLVTGGWSQRWVEGALGQDLDASLNFFTVSAEPESQERISLGVSTTAVTVNEPDERLMLRYTNDERTARGLPPLMVNARVQAVARMYGRRMLAQGYFSHLDSDGHNPFDRMQAAGIVFGTAGENLALAPTVQLAEAGLINSPGHRANILSPSYREAGIGVMDAGPYGLMIVEDFTD